MDFGASDAPLKPDELDEAGLVQFPVVMGGVVPVINVSGLKSGDLKLSPDVLAGIFLGRSRSGTTRRSPFPMSVADNISFGVRLYERLSRADMEDRVQWALQKAALWDEVKDKLRQDGTALSGGQQQRLCIARAVAVKPEILLLDEPASALDPISTQKIEQLISELKADYTIAVVTHNMQQAARVSDFTAFMYLGRLIEFGDTKTLFTQPRERQTEEYITGRFG